MRSPEAILLKEEGSQLLKTQDSSLKASKAQAISKLSHFSKKINIF